VTNFGKCRLRERQRRKSEPGGKERASLLARNGRAAPTPLFIADWDLRWTSRRRRRSPPATTAARSQRSRPSSSAGARIAHSSRAPNKHSKVSYARQKNDLKRLRLRPRESFPSPSLPRRLKGGDDLRFRGLGRKMALRFEVVSCARLRRRREGERGLRS